MKIRNWFWGVFFILAGGLIIINQMGYLTGVSLFSLIATILVIPILVKSIFHLNFAGILFPLAILGILYAEPLGIQNLTPWPILATALFASIGLSFLFPMKRYSHCCHTEEGFEQVIDNPDSSQVECRVSFGSAIKYINTEDFKTANLSCSFGAMKVYFDNAKIQGDNATLQLEVSFGALELYLPKDWKIINEANVTLGGIEEKQKTNTSKEGPTLTLTGKVSFSGVEIRYIS